MVRQLADAGHDCLVYDNLSTGHRWAVDPRATLIEADLADQQTLSQVLTQHPIDAVFHFAAYIVVPESVAEPLRYYRNNCVNTLLLIEACVHHGIDKFIFSSTAAVYGNGRDDNQPLTENDSIAPINPYGNSKRISETFLADTAATGALRYVALRYFNVAGAHPDGSIGQATPDATHLIKVACEAASGKRQHIHIFGTDYPTDDGTCIRDYIHIQDLIQAHLLSLEYLASGGNSQTFNCGYGHGASVREVIQIAQEVSQQKFKVIESERRAGDPPQLIANSNTLQRQLNWQPQYDDITSIISHAWQWEQLLSRR